MNMFLPLPQPETPGIVASIHSPPTARCPEGFRLALVGTFAPRKCGIATFTSDMFEKFAEYHPEMDVDVYAIDDPAAPAAYAPSVAGVIACDSAAAYEDAARRINESGADAVWLQHEYGIFGGPDGAMVCDFVDRIAAPLVLTCHTVLSEPSERQAAIMRHLVSRASRIMVMSRLARDLLAQIYGAKDDVVEVIEHGAPDRPFGRQHQFKDKFGLGGRKVMMTFGLLGPGKGLESALRAMPAIIARHPDVIYRIVGATHPRLVAEEGETYRHRLLDLTEALGISGHVEWVDRFLDTDELLDHLEACDIYVTPYPGLQQSTSGTLSYAVALGKAVISTPYVHARELLAQDVGRLIEPGSSEAIAKAVNALFDRPDELSAMQRRAYARGRITIWPQFAGALARLALSALPHRPRHVPLGPPPGLSGLLSMCDATGMFQHATGIVPDRRHGYCVDDNARALMLMNVVEGLSPEDRLRWSTVFAAFVEYAWNPDIGRFRNFMRFDRSWAEESGSEDSNGRSLWALGHTVALSDNADLSRWALELYRRAVPSVAAMEAPRTLAFAMLGAELVLNRHPDDRASLALLERGGAFLQCLLNQDRSSPWPWFEDGLGYDNPRLSQALLAAGAALGRQDWIDSGLASLRWICTMQLSAQGLFRPVGSETFGRAGATLPFDQQPLEAQAAIEAAASAWRLTDDAFWLDHARTAWRWFLGDNDRGVVLGDIASGRCRDGLTPRGANENCGAESILAFQLSYYAIASMQRSANGEDNTRGKDRTGTDGRAGTGDKGLVLEPARSPRL